MKNHIRVGGKLLIYNVKRRKDASADIWVGPYIVEAVQQGNSARLRSTFGATAAGASSRMAIPAPMPGLVNRVDVALGAPVQAGDGPMAHLDNRCVQEAGWSIRPLVRINGIDLHFG